MVAALLERCADSGAEERLACAEAIGELGAIDPSHLTVPIHTRHHERMSDDQLAHTLIATHLLRAIRAATDTASQDRALLAIQELLYFLECRHGDVIKMRNASKEEVDSYLRAVPSVSMLPTLCCWHEMMQYVHTCYTCDSLHV